MQLGVRGRILLWLSATVLPTTAIGILAASVVESRLEDRVESELLNVLGLEAARIARELEALERSAEDLAGRASVQVVVEDVGTASPDARPLDQLADDLVAAATDANRSAAAVWLFDVDGGILGASEAASHVPENVTGPGETRFAPAYRAASNDDRMPVETAIIGSDGTPVGVLVVDWDIAPTIDLLASHESFGETSEAHLAQPTAEGDAAFITLLRFERDAAFSKVVPGSLDAPIVNSLNATEPTVVHSPDYRGEPSVLAYRQTEATGWGLVVKIDQSEVLGTTSIVRTALTWRFALMLVSGIAGWALVLRPLLLRIRRASTAAERIAGGDYREPIADDGSDEIAEMANSIDRLASDLAEDIVRRSAAEAQLRHQATHDQLTGVSNRLHCERLLRSRLGALEPDERLSLLFLDLDGFKEINDTWGHAVGDEVLVEVAARLRRSSPSTALVARWGGDEFVILLPHEGADDAARIARDVRAAFSAPFETSIGEHPLDASIGAATANPATSADELIHLADGRMFGEKQRHRHARLLSSGTARQVEVEPSDDRIEAWAGGPPETASR